MKVLSIKSPQTHTDKAGLTCLSSPRERQPSIRLLVCDPFICENSYARISNGVLQRRFRDYQSRGYLNGS